MNTQSTALVVGLLLAALAMDAGWLHMDMALRAARTLDGTVDWVIFWR